MDFFLYLSIYVDRHIDDIDAMTININIDIDVDIDISQLKNINKFEAVIDKFMKTSSTSRMLYYLPTFI